MGNAPEPGTNHPDQVLALRLVIAKVIDPVPQKELACWYLLSNVFDVSSATPALWYYYHWRIESYFKLLKSGGQEIGHWQQESGLALLKRLLVASMEAASRKSRKDRQRREHCCPACLCC
ncbi:hypothetical protein FACS189454_05660 [Planctomycetales bacterium]|nr:hypothetical protein FACS189454_05660 [Planctomycetales bacterium]